MATETFGDVTGSLDDSVRLVIGTETVVVAESYEVHHAILTQPSTFTLRLGWGSVLQGLIAKCTPGTPFQLLIGDVLQHTGQIDGYEANSDGSSGGTLSIHGRDNLAKLHDAFVTEEKSYEDKTYYEMVESVLLDIVGTHVLTSYNDANRKLTTGIGVVPTAQPDTTNATAPSAKQLRTRIGERWYEFLKRELDRAGLFLWTAADGSYVLSAPNANQPPIYKIIRQRGQTRNAVNVEVARYRNATEGRYSHAIVYGKGGGKKAGRTKYKGEFDDPEMIAWGFNRPLVLRDVNVSNSAQAEFYARRKLAETRRAGWNLTYSAAGHTIPSLLTGERAVWAVDTVVSVVDEELGLSGDYYVEQVVFRRNPATTTEITLMRPDDLLFGASEFEGG